MSNHPSQWLTPSWHFFKICLGLCLIFQLILFQYLSLMNLKRKLKTYTYGKYFFQPLAHQTQLLWLFHSFVLASVLRGLTASKRSSGFSLLNECFRYQIVSEWWRTLCTEVWESCIGKPRGVQRNLLKFKMSEFTTFRVSVRQLEFDQPDKSSVQSPRLFLIC